MAQTTILAWLMKQYEQQPRNAYRIKDISLACDIKPSACGRSIKGLLKAQMIEQITVAYNGDKAYRIHPRTFNTIKGVS